MKRSLPVCPVGADVVRSASDLNQIIGRPGWAQALAAATRTTFIAATGKAPKGNAVNRKERRRAIAQRDVRFPPQTMDQYHERANLGFDTWVREMPGEIAQFAIENPDYALDRLLIEVRKEGLIISAGLGKEQGELFVDVTSEVYRARFADFLARELTAERAAREDQPSETASPEAPTG